MPTDTTLTAAAAETAYHILEHWLKRRGLDDWMDDLSVVFLDANSIQLYCRRNPAGSRHGIADADEQARVAVHAPCAYGAALKDNKERPMGSVGINTRRDPAEALVMCAHLAIFTLDPGLEDDSLRLVMEEFFIAAKINPPIIPSPRMMALGISSQAGLASVMRGAALQDAQPGGMYGVPPLGEPSLPRPAPGTDLITGVPGFGGGLHG